VWKAVGEAQFLEEVEGRLRAQKFFACDEWGELVTGVT